MPSHGSYCDQLTQRGYPCGRRATVVGIGRDGREELYCTQHANYYGVKRRKWRPVEQAAK